MNSGEEWSWKEQDRKTGCSHVTVSSHWACIYINWLQTVDRAGGGETKKYTHSLLWLLVLAGGSSLVFVLAIERTPTFYPFLVGSSWRPQNDRYLAKRGSGQFGFPWEFLILRLRVLSHVHKVSVTSTAVGWAGLSLQDLNNRTLFSWTPASRRDTGSRSGWCSFSWIVPKISSNAKLVQWYIFTR